MEKPVVQVRLTPEQVAWLDQRRGDVEARSSLVRRLLEKAMREEQGEARA
jgi:hypothetical protein